MRSTARTASCSTASARVSSWPRTWRTSCCAWAATHTCWPPHEAVAATVLHAAPTVAIGFSHAGSTIETVRFLETARAHGAGTIAVTSAKGSPLARAADHALFTEVRESSFRAGAMVSRIAQLALVDCLFIGVAKRRFAETVDALQRTHDAMHALRD